MEDFLGAGEGDCYCCLRGSCSEFPTPTCLLLLPQGRSQVHGAQGFLALDAAVSPLGLESFVDTGVSLSGAEHYCCLSSYLAVCLSTVVQDDVDTFWTSPASLPPATVSAVDIRHPCSGRSGCSGYQTPLQWLQWLQWPQWPQWLQWPAQHNLTLVGFRCKI